jgi:hypothetical protein
LTRDLCPGFFTASSPPPFPRLTESGAIAEDSHQLSWQEGNQGEGILQLDAQIQMKVGFDPV